MKNLSASLLLGLALLPQISSADSLKAIHSFMDPSASFSGVIKTKSGTIVASSYDGRLFFFDSGLKSTAVLQTPGALMVPPVEMKDGSIAVVSSTGDVSFVSTEGKLLHHSLLWDGAYTPLVSRDDDSLWVTEYPAYQDLLTPDAKIIDPTHYRIPHTKQEFVVPLPNDCALFEYYDMGSDEHLQDLGCYLNGTVASDGTVYAFSSDGKVVKMNTVGDPDILGETGSAITGVPLLMADGTLAVATVDGSVRLFPRSAPTSPIVIKSNFLVSSELVEAEPEILAYGTQDGTLHLVDEKGTEVSSQKVLNPSHLSAVANPADVSENRAKLPRAAAGSDPAGTAMELRKNLRLAREMLDEPSVNWAKYQAAIKVIEDQISQVEAKYPADPELPQTYFGLLRLTEQLPGSVGKLKTLKRRLWLASRYNDTWFGQIAGMELLPEGYTASDLPHLSMGSSGQLLSASENGTLTVFEMKPSWMFW